MARNRRFRGRIESQWLRQANGEHSAHAAAKEAWEEEERLQKHYTEFKIELTEGVELTSGIERAIARLTVSATAKLAELTDDAVIGRLHVRATPAPPKAAELILSFVCKREQLEATLGDMEELFGSQVARFGARSATAWYWWEILRSSLAFIARSIRAAIGLESLLKRL